MLIDLRREFSELVVCRSTALSGVRVIPGDVLVRIRGGIKGSSVFGRSFEGLTVAEADLALQSAVAVHGSLALTFSRGSEGAHFECSLGAKCSDECQVIAHAAVNVIARPLTSRVPEAEFKDDVNEEVLLYFESPLQQQQQQKKNQGQQNNQRVGAKSRTARKAWQRMCRSAMRASRMGQLPGVFHQLRPRKVHSLQVEEWRGLVTAEREEKAAQETGCVAIAEPDIRWTPSMARAFRRALFAVGRKNMAAIRARMARDLGEGDAISVREVTRAFFTFFRNPEQRAWRALCALTRCDAQIFHNDQCSVCVSPRGEVLMCDTCNLSVHLDCVGLDEVPQGLWTCAQCDRLHSTARNGALLRRAAEMYVRRLDEE